jgi:high-affinity nickel permease
VAADEFHTKMKISILTFPILFAKLLIQVDSYDNSCGIVLLQTLMGSNGVQIKN